MTGEDTGEHTPVIPESGECVKNRIFHTDKGGIVKYGDEDWKEKFLPPRAKKNPETPP